MGNGTTVKFVSPPFTSQNDLFAPVILSIIMLFSKRGVAHSVGHGTLVSCGIFTPSLKVLLIQ